VRNNPLKYIDPTGEEVFSTNLSDKEKKMLIADLQNKTGFKSISFDKHNKLVIDVKAGFEKGSDAARTQLLAAVDSTDIRFNLRSVDNLMVAFASVDAGTTIGVGGRTVRTDYTVNLDFGDFNRVSGDAEAKAAYTISFATLHEFAHKMYNVSDFPNSDTDPGPLENTYINPIRRELGLAERRYYTAKQVSGPLKSFFPGGGQELKFRLNGKDKILRWQNDLVGGKEKGR
jgi:hypothetical protein